MLGRQWRGDDQVEIGEVDCGAKRSVCTKADIHSYPTYKVFYNGEEVARYQGPRNVESLKAFVLDEVEKAAEKAHDNDSELSLVAHQVMVHRSSHIEALIDKNVLFEIPSA